MSSLAWNDALAACGPAAPFSDKEKAAGWPAAMEVKQLAAIQRPFASGDSAGRHAREALRKALEAACESGALPSHTETRTVHVETEASRKARRDFGMGWVDRPLESSMCAPPAVYTSGEVPVVKVRPGDFIQWLEAQGQAPSVHVKAWAAAIAAPGEKASPFPLADWAALVSYRRANPRTSWAVGNQIAIVKDEFQRLGGNQPGQKRKTLTTLAQQLDMTSQPLERAVWGDRKRKAAHVGAAPLPAAATPKRRAAAR